MTSTGLWRWIGEIDSRAYYERSMDNSSTIDDLVRLELVRHISRGMGLLAYLANLPSNEKPSAPSYRLVSDLMNASSAFMLAASKLRRPYLRKGEYLDTNVRPRVLREMDVASLLSSLYSRIGRVLCQVIDGNMDLVAADRLEEIATEIGSACKWLGDS